MMGAHPYGGQWCEECQRRHPGMLEEYERLTAERNRLIARGVPAEQLTKPMRPEAAHDRVEAD